MDNETSRKRYHIKPTILNLYPILSLLYLAQGKGIFLINKISQIKKWSKDKWSGYSGKKIK